MARLQNEVWEKNLQGQKSWALTPQTSAKPLGFCRTFLPQAFYYVKPSAQPSCRTPKVLRKSGEDERPGLSLGLAFFPLKVGTIYLFFELRSLLRKMLRNFPRSLGLLPLS